MTMNSLVSIDTKDGTMRRYERADGKSFRLTHRCQAVAGTGSISSWDVMVFRRNPNAEFAIPVKTLPMNGGEAA